MNEPLLPTGPTHPVTTIKFRATYIARDLGFDKGLVIRFNSKSPGKPFLTLRQIPEADESEYSHRSKPGDILCIAELESTPARKIREWIDEGGGTPPSGFNAFVNEAFRDLAQAVRKALQLIQWRVGYRGVPNPIRWSPKFEWSIDGHTWHGLAAPIGHVPLKIRFGDKNFPDEVVDSLHAMWGKGDREPLAHNLFQEAWSQVHANPRSSLVIGIAAAETGMKQLVSDLAPDSSWLVQNIQSPPLVQMLEGYLPALPSRVTINKKPLPPLPESLLEVLKKGVSLRNKIIHGKKVSLGQESLIEILNTISDLLYIFDLYAGQIWAQKRVRGDTLRDWLKVQLFDSFPFTIYT